MPIVLRYLDREITKDFIAFVECQQGITGQAIADYIVNTDTHWTFLWAMHEASAMMQQVACQTSTMELLHWSTNMMVLTKRIPLTAQLIVSAYVR